MGILIRDAEKNDAATVSAIYYRSWQWAYNGILPDSFLESLTPDFWEKDIRRDLANGVRSGLILEVDGVPAGAATMRASSFPSFPDDGELVSIYLVPEKAGQGLGKTLITRCEASLRAKGYAHCVLDALQANERALNFYLAMGYVATDHRTTQVIGDAVLPLLILRKLLCGDTAP